jgi:uncharacterized protein (DUF2062 family)
MKPALATPASRVRTVLDKARLAARHAGSLALALVPGRPRRQTREAAREEAPPSLAHPIRFFRQLCVEHSSPGELAAAVWVGIFVGALPIIPFGIAAIVYVCHRLRLNKLAGAGASNLCIAPFVPLLCIEAGHFLRYGQWWTAFTRQTLVYEIHLRLWEWLIGALLIGPVLGALGALLTYVAVSALRRR